MSRKEAQTFDDAMADVMAELSDKMAGEQARAAEMAVPRERLFETITDKLMDAGFTPTTARTQAALLAQRYATRSARPGRELTGDEFSDVLVNKDRTSVVSGKSVEVRVGFGGGRSSTKK